MRNHREKSKRDLIEELVALQKRAREIVGHMAQMQGGSFEARRRLLIESDMELFTFLENLPGMAYRCRNDSGLTMDFVSEGSRNLTGYEPGAFLEKGHSFYHSLILPDDRQWVSDQVQQALSEKRPFELVYRIRAASSQEKWVWDKGVGFFAEDGSLIAVDGFIADITELKRMEVELREAHATLRAYNQELEKLVHERTKELIEKTKQLAAAEKLAAIGQMANRVAHELRNPITVIGGFARRLDNRKSEGDPDKQYLKIILTELARLEAKVAEIIKFQELDDEDTGSGRSIQENIETT